MDTRFVPLLSSDLSIKNVFVQPQWHLTVGSVLLVQVEVCTIPVDELSDADEVFCTGTAVVVARVGSITYKGNR